MKKNKNRLIVVLGMHRSGTSAITRGLKVLGVELGDNLSNPIKGVNEKGFWEDVDFNTLNVEMLQSLNSDWHFLTPILPSDLDALTKNGYLARAIKLLEKKTSDTRFFGFKDPRTTKLLPFWKEVIRHCQLDANYVLAVRHPLSVVKSLFVRDGFDAEKSYLLWLGHIITSFADTVGDNRILVDYDRLMQSPDRELNRIANRFNLEIDPIAMQAYKTEFLDEKLRHTVYDLNDLLLDDACPTLVYEVYTTLLDLASDEMDLDGLMLQNKLIHWARDFENLKSSLKLLDQYSVQIAEKEQTVQALMSHMAEKEQSLQLLSLQVAEKDQIIQQQKHFHDALVEIINSRSWKMVLVLQKIRLWLLPANSFQARAVRYIYTIFRGAIRGFRSAVLFCKKSYRYVRENGVKETFMKIKYRLKQRQLTIKLDDSARVSLQNILKPLGLYAESEQVMNALIHVLGRERTRRVMANIIEVEKIIFTQNNGEVYPIIHASQLPASSPRGHKRKILFITAEFPNPHHGGGNRVLNFIKALSTDNNIYLCTAYFPKEHEQLIPRLTPYCQEILKIPYGRFGGNQEQIRSWLGTTPIDIVHYEWPRSLENFSADIGRIQIFTFMEAVSLRLLMDMERLTPLSAVWLEKLEQLAYAMWLEFVQASMVDARIAVTEKDAKFFGNLCPSQEYAVLNHGLDFEEFVLPEVAGEPDALAFVGNYMHYPNAEALEYFFNEIWENIRREIPDIRIYVVGANPTNTLRSRADGKHIIITGTVKDVRPYIQKATVCIAPLISGAGLRGKVIEYAALHRPFVATSIAATDLVFKDGIDYFCADTAAEFSDKIITLLKDPQLAGEMADAAYRTACQNYDNQRLTGHLLSFYEHLENRPDV